ncbi:MAG: methylenetetrahydrofolate reductase C-terminal domain-containing protein, partial [Oscillospiraceae bacterium]|nr:methylenetetrahydrofolate reductase C-terminal domain-containing protein [Oscillospiraceae bacterium]
MENYTKYALKPAEELQQVLSQVDDIFVIACNKCFREFTAEGTPELDAFLAIAEAEGKHITGAVRTDFLCNSHHTEMKLQALPEGTKAVVAIGCGLGIQTVADRVQLPVFAGADSLNYNGHHGMALTKKACDACAQCYLNITGGICPIVDCSKSLVNGQCGGAKDGKCEVSPDKDCAWEKIQRRLEQQGRLGELTAQPVQLRDHSKTSHKLVESYVAAIRDLRFAGYYGGVHPSEHKEYTEHKPLVTFPAPEQVVIPLSMHAGAPANPIVQVGDKVKLGQKIGEAAGFISANVHSSVSGEVIAIEERPHANRGMCLSVVIRNDMQDTPAETLQPAGSLEALTPAQIVEIVKDAGIVGMGGAGFPTNVKLAPPKPIDTVLLNGCECEPYLTADHRVLLEYADDVIFGLQAMLKAVNAPKGVIVIEDNKPDAIRLLEEKTAD